MNQLLKITQILIFTILILLVGVFVVQFFNSFASLLLLPLGVLSIYYLLIYSFAKLVKSSSKIWLYVGIIFIVMPLITFAFANKVILEFSYNILQAWAK